LARLRPGLLWAQLNKAALAEVQRGYVSRSRLKVAQQDKQMKRALSGKECSRTLALSSCNPSASSSHRNNSFRSDARRRSSNSSKSAGRCSVRNSSSSSGSSNNNNNNEEVGLRELNAIKHSANRKVGINGHRGQRRLRQGSNN
jgi:hypothetical protein